MALVASSLVPMDRLGRLWPHAEPVEHTLGRLGARSARAARGGEMSRIIKSDDGTFDVDVACRPVRTLHVKDGVSLVVFTTVVPYHPRRPTDLMIRTHKSLKSAPNCVLHIMKQRQTPFNYGRCARAESESTALSKACERHGSK